MFAIQRSDENELQGKFLPACFASRVQHRLGTDQICSLNQGFVISQNLDITNLRGNDLNVRYIEVIVIQKIVYVNKETGFSVMLHYPTFHDSKRR